MSKQYIYIIQASLEKSKCKIGKTNDYERRLKEYNSITGKSQDNAYSILFCAEVSDMAALEGEITRQFSHLREHKSREIYFYNEALFEMYVDFIKKSAYFREEIIIKAEEKPQIKIIKKVTPTLESRGISRKDSMQNAKNIDNDEFYTRLEDVEKELNCYPLEVFENKVVFCNCDDAVDDDERRASAFSIFFLKNFERLGLKKLICLHYSGPVDLFHQGPKGYIFTKDGFDERKDYPRHYNGSFAHPISLKILHEEADLVCTNPPFSKAIEYWKTLIQSGKKFIIIGNITNAINTAFIPYFMEKKAWAGFHSVDNYQNPKRELVTAAGHWYTNITLKNRPKSRLLKIIPLDEIPQKNKTIDDAGILLVSGGFIPSDYAAPFAVSARAILNGVLENGYKIVQETQYVPYVRQEKRFSKVLIQKAKIAKKARK